MTGSHWSPERKAQLTTLWAEGKSASKIATVMKSTRSAVLGEARRLDLARRQTGPARHRGKPPPFKPKRPLQPSTQTELRRMLTEAVRNTIALG